jgi:hypothetical protein
VSLTGGGLEHNAEAGLEEKAVQQNEVFVAVRWSDEQGDDPRSPFQLFLPGLE